MGFIMGWSMFLECQFATITTALATGGYIAFLLNPSAPSDTVAVWAALATVLFGIGVWIFLQPMQMRGMTGAMM